MLNNIDFVEYPRPLACSYADIRELRDANIVIYFPHGLGDWVMFSCVAPFLNCNNNQLYITRFGDDYVSLQNNSNTLRPLYSGLPNVHCNDGHDYDRHHFHFHIPDATLKVTATMAAKLQAINCTHICFDGFPEVGGNYYEFPFHSKPRNVLRKIYHAMSAVEKATLNNPLPSCVNTHANDLLTEFVLTRLRQHTPYNSKTKLILISRYGLTSCGKNWGHLFRSEQYPNEADECREFISLCRKKNSNTVFVSLEHVGVSGAGSLIDAQNNVFGFHNLFGNDAGCSIFTPFASTLLALMRVADIHVGCPTGSSGVATLFPNLTNVIVWIELFPSWYFEPTANTVNLISANSLHQRQNQVGSFDSNKNVCYRNAYVDTLNVSGEAVFNFVEFAL